MKKSIYVFTLSIILLAGSAYGASSTNFSSPPDNTAYDATTWNGSLRAPTKNAVRDYLETVAPGGVVATASALAANGANCSAGQAPLGVDAAGAVEGCFAVQAYNANLTAYTETVTAGGTADALTADFATDITAAAGTRVRVIAAAANTATAPTLCVDTCGTPRAIVKLGGVALVAGDIKGAGHVLELQYDLANTRWELLNPANPGSAAADSVDTSNIPVKNSAGTYINLTLDGLELSGTTTQTIKRSAVQTTVGTSRTVAKNAEYVFCTAACSVTPLAPVAGRELCVKNAPGTTGAITLTNITDVYYGKTDGSGWQANANYKLVSGGAATDQICIVGYDTTHYIVMNSTGTWTHTAP